MSMLRRTLKGALRRISPTYRSICYAIDGISRIEEEQRKTKDMHKQLVADTCREISYSFSKNSESSVKKAIRPPVEMTLPIVDILKLQMVEIETFSFCNRKCWFCPNSFIDRSSKNDYMDEKTYTKILKELSLFKFKGTISYSRYNEPLADPVIFERLEQARKILPNATLHTNTNGDYLTHESLNMLKEAGLTTLNIQHYLAHDATFDKQQIYACIDEMAEKLGIAKPIKELQHRKRCGKKLDFDGIEIQMYAIDFAKTGTNRGDSLSTIQPISRVKPCPLPFRDIYIDYDGSVMPCCNVRSDYAPHAEFIMGNVTNDSIFSIINNENYINFRHNIIHNVSEFSPCNTCNM